MPATQKVNTMAARIERIERAQATQKRWQTNHQRDCLRVYKKIQADTSVLPEMKAQLDAQDELLTGIRDIKATFRVTRPVGIALGAIVASAVGLVQVLQYLAEYFGR